MQEPTQRTREDGRRRALALARLSKDGPHAWAAEEAEASLYSSFALRDLLQVLQRNAP